MIEVDDNSRDDDRIIPATEKTSDILYCEGIDHFLIIT